VLRTSTGKRSSQGLLNFVGVLFQL